MNYTELTNRIEELKSRKGRGSISADETFSLLMELAEKTRAVDINAGSLTIRRLYTSVAAMNADKNPMDQETGKPLKFGQLVCVCNSNDLTLADNGRIYRYNKPGWEFLRQVGDMVQFAKTEEVSNKITQIEAKHTPFIADGYDLVERKFWNEWLLAVEIPNSVIPSSLNGNPYPVPTTGWSFAEGVITPQSFNFSLYRSASNWGYWEEKIRFVGSKFSETGIQTIKLSNGIYITVNVDKWPTENYSFSSLTLATAIRPEIWKQNYFPSICDFKSNEKIKDVGFEKTTPFKDPVNIPDRFRNSFMDIRFNGDVADGRHYGLVYVVLRSDGLLFDNYSWDDFGFSALGDSFVIPISTIQTRGLQYYKSPKGLFEFLVDFSKLIENLSIPPGGGNPVVIISGSKLYEFSDTVLNNYGSKHLMDLGRITNVYPDSLMISENERAIHDITKGLTAFSTYSLIQWCNLSFGGTINRITVNAWYSNGKTRCVVKVFDSLIQLKNALNDSVGTTVFDRVLQLSDYVDSSLTTAIIEVSETYVTAGKYIGAIYINLEATEGTVVKISHLFYRAPYDPISGGTPFYLKSSLYDSTYMPAVVNESYAYYQLPLIVNSKYPLEQRVRAIESKISKLEVAATNPRIVLPSKLYAVVGKEFNLYYDAFTLLPDIGTPQPNILFDITCSIGATNDRSFRLTPTNNQIGSYSLIVSVYDSEEHLIATKQTTLIVVPSTNPTVIKHIFCIGDSTTDDTAQVIFGLRANLDDLTGGVSPVLVGHKPYYNNTAINHGAATGKTLGFYANGITVLKFNFTGLPDGLGVYPNLTFSLPDGTGYIVNIETQVQNDGSGKGYSIANVWTAGSSLIGAGYAGTLKTNGQAGFPSIVTVESTEQLTAWSPIRFDGIINFSAYATHIGLAHGEKIDLFSIDLGINDSRGSIQNEAIRMSILNNAIALAEAFNVYNPAGIVMFCLPKSCANPRSLNSAQHDTYRVNIHTLRENLIKAFDNNPDYPYCCVSNSGLSIDRFYGYPISNVKAAARFSENIQINGDDVHPRTEGYRQVADSMVGCMIYQLTK